MKNIILIDGVVSSHTERCCVGGSAYHAAKTCQVGLVECHCAKYARVRQLDRVSAEHMPHIYVSSPAG